MISRSAVTLAVAANFPANTLEKLVAVVKKTPGKHRCAAFGQGMSANISERAVSPRQRQRPPKADLDFRRVQDSNHVSSNGSGSQK